MYKELNENNLSVIKKRAEELLSQYLNKVYKDTNYLFAALFVIQWAACIIAAYLISPRTWSGVYSETHIHVWLAISFGGMLTLLPLIPIITNPTGTFTRHLVAACQVAFSSLLIHLSGGRIETHFHIFGSLAFLSFYKDWKVLITATTVVVVDHLFRGIYWPESVYGVFITSNWRTLEHGAWVIFEDLVLYVSCKRAVNELRNIAESQSILESTNIIIEQQVEQRTKDLSAAHEDLKQARDKAIALAKVKSEFLANISHEIRTPLNGVIGTLELVMENNLDEEQSELIRTSQSSARSLLSIINDLLDVAKFESGKFVLSPANFNLDELLNECVSLLSPLAAEKEITLISEKAKDTPDFIFGDDGRLKQVLINLIGNSIKFTSRGGGILLLVESKEIADDMLELHFTVSDCGKGIPSDKINNIFEAFTQEDNSIVREYGGTGLGLTISKSIVDLMGGELKVTSIEKVGTRFEFYIKARITHFQRKQNMISEFSENSRYKILLAEDNNVNQKITAKMLKNKGLNVTIVENGKLALEALSKSEFNLVLMDIQMPVMDGIETIRQIRDSKEKWRNLPIIALTANSLSVEQEKYLALGADGFLNKPIDKEQFFSTIFRYLKS